MAHKIGPECIGCGACAGGCPTGCIHEDGGVYVINAAECIDCRYLCRQLSHRRNQS